MKRIDLVKVCTFTGIPARLICRQFYQVIYPQSICFDAEECIDVVLLKYDYFKFNVNKKTVTIVGFRGDIADTAKFVIGERNSYEIIF